MDEIERLHRQPIRGGVRPPTLKKDVIDAMLKAGTTARVDSQVSRTLAPAKLLALGVFGATKKTGQIYLYFTDADGVDVEMVKLDPVVEPLARKWAVAFNQVVVSRRQQP